MKNKKRILLIAFFLLGISSLFATSVVSQKIYIKNKLGKTLSIECELKNAQIVSKMSNWEQEIADCNVDCFSTLQLNNEFKLNTKKLIIRITPNVPLKNVRDNLNKIVNYPLEQKFKEIFSEFNVKDENGVVLLTLDTISKAKIESEYDGDIINIILDESLYKEGE